MEFSAFFLCTSPEVNPAEEVYADAFEFTRLAEELGYDSGWFAEHHFSNYGYIPNPLLFIVRAAQETERIRLGTGVLVLPFWDPIRAAEDIAMTDQLTNGRLEIGVARGYQPYEYTRFGLSHDDARERTDEALAIMLKALTTDEFTHDGQYHKIPETTIFPKSLQRPHPPIWLAASSRQSFEVGERYGLNAITTISTRPTPELSKAWENYLGARVDVNISTPSQFAVQQNIVVAPTDEEAREQMFNVRYNHRQAHALRLGQQQVREGVSEELPYEGEPTLDDLFDERTFSGSPETVRRKLQAAVDLCEISRLNCVFRLGSMSPDTVKQSMRLFAEQVMPAFR